MTIQEIKQTVDIVAVIEQHVPLKRKGANHVGNCPFHEERSDSLVVSQSKQMYKCFGCGASGDVIDFTTRYSNIDIPTAIRVLSGDDRLILDEPTRQTIERKRNKNEWEQLPIWDSEIPATFVHFEYGKPSEIYAYRNLKNELIGYTCKFLFPDGSKQVLPYTYGQYENGVKSWRYGGFKSPRPMYGMEFFGAYPNATVILVEGEKCADYGNRLIQASDYKTKFIFMSWIGGSDAVQQTDFSILADRNTILWPDNDEPGAKAMKKIHSFIGGKFIDVPTEYPKKWDVADSGFTASEIVQFIETRQTVKPFRYVTETEPEPEIILPEPVVKPKQPDPIGDGYFKTLGYSKSDKGGIAYWFYSYEHKMVIQLTSSSITKSNLMMLAPIQWWQGKYPSGGNSKIDTDSIAQMLISACNQRGVFSSDKIRGRGAWRDGDDIVLHMGTHLVVNGKRIELEQYDSEYLYEINRNIQYGGGKPLSNEEASKFLELIKWFSWEKPTTAYKFAGWLLIAPFCGVLDWRPQGWLTATSGAGKSWIQDNLVSVVLGDVALSMNADTTSAGIRQSLMSDSRPIIFDETEAGSIKNRERLQEIIELMRSCASPKGLQSIKGTQSGTAITYNIKTMSMFSSIGVSLVNRADIRRFSVFGLRKDATKRGDSFEEFKRVFYDTITPEYIAGLQQRTINLLPVIIHNTKIFGIAATRMLGSNELGSQLGGMIAGAYSLTSTKTITLEKATEFLERNNWDDERLQEEQKDEMMLFDMIMDTPIKVDTNFNPTIGEVLTYLYNGDGTDRFKTEYIEKELKYILLRIGVRIVGDYICIANNNVNMHRLLKDSPWIDSMRSMLLRLPGAEKDNSREYERGVSGLGVKIPINLLIK